MPLVGVMGPSFGTCPEQRCAPRLCSPYQGGGNPDEELLEGLHRWWWWERTQQQKQGVGHSSSGGQKGVGPSLMPKQQHRCGVLSKGEFGCLDVGNRGGECEKTKCEETEDGASYNDQ